MDEESEEIFHPIRVHGFCKDCFGKQAVYMQSAEPCIPQPITKTACFEPEAQLIPLSENNPRHLNQNPQRRDFQGISPQHLSSKGRGVEIVRSR